MHSKPIRDDAGKRLFDAVYNDDGTVAITLKQARQLLVITLDSVRAQIEAGQREADAIAGKNTTHNTKKR
jgi:hypothetical protein